MAGMHTPLSRPVWIIVITFCWPFWQWQWQTPVCPGCNCQTHVPKQKILSHSPIYKELHWLPIHQYNLFQILVIHPNRVEGGLTFYHTNVRESLNRALPTCYQCMHSISVIYTRNVLFGILMKVLVTLLVVVLAIISINVIVIRRASGLILDSMRHVLSLWTTRIVSKLFPYGATLAHSK